MKGWVVFHVPSGLYYHPFYGLVRLERAYVSTEPRDFEGSNEYVSMFHDNTQQNNDGQRHFVAGDFNRELKAAMNKGDKDIQQVPVTEKEGPRFIHYRAIRDATPVELGINPVKEMYIDSRGGATVCFIPASAEEQQPIVYAVANCHPNDNYNKRLGRVKSQGRLKSDHVDHGRQVTQMFDTKDFIQTIDAEMEQWGYVRIVSKKRRKAKTLMLPAPEVVVAAKPETTGVEPGSTTVDDHDGPNYSSDETKAA